MKLLDLENVNCSLVSGTPFGMQATLPYKAYLKASDAALVQHGAVLEVQRVIDLTEC